MSDPRPPSTLAEWESIVRSVIHESPAARALADRLHAWLGAVLQVPAAPRNDAPAIHVPPAASGPGPTAPPPEAMTTLRLGGQRIAVRVQGTAADAARAESARPAASAAPPLIDPDYVAAAEIDLGLVQRRCRLKAAACEVAVRRRAAVGDPVVEPRVVDELNDMIHEAKHMPGCFLWMFYPAHEQPTDAQFGTLAHCYTALGMAAAAVSEVMARPSGGQAEMLQVMQLLAESDSALRVALEWSWLSTKPDTDQDEVHHWLKRQTTLLHVYVPRFMRVDDRADPGEAERVVADVAAIMRRRRARADAASDINREFGRVQFHAKEIDKGNGVFSHHAGKIDAALAALAALGVPESDRRIGERLGPAASPLATDESVPRRVRLAAQRALEALVESESPETEPMAREHSARVAELRDLIRGTNVVVVGGEARPVQRDNIRDAFDLQNVEWVQINEHASAAPLEAPIARTTTSLVLVLIKVTGHLHSDVARDLAARYRKPLVRLPAGFNPEQVAEQALTQVGERLRATAAQAGAGAGR